MGNSQGKMESEEERRRNIKKMDEQMNKRFGRAVKHKSKELFLILVFSLTM